MRASGLPLNRSRKERGRNPTGCRSLILRERPHVGVLGGQPPPSMPAPSARKSGVLCRSGRFAPSRYTPLHSREIRSQPMPRHGPPNVWPPSKIIVDGREQVPVTSLRGDTWGVATYGCTPEIPAPDSRRPFSDFRCPKAHAGDHRWVSRSLSRSPI
jgi:hypothetical protein